MADDKMRELAEKIELQPDGFILQRAERILRAELKPLLDAAYVALVYDSAHDACDSECPMRRLDAGLRGWRKD